MNFNQLDYWPGLLALFILFFAIVFAMEKRFFRFVKSYWFYRRSFFSYVSTGLFLLGMAGLIFSLMDIRGPEEKIKTEVPEDRTIILMDTSASMLSEDVKPSRLQKAALIAKHFARKAAGQQLSIVAFAEIQKKIVPFTNDLDLIDARLDSLEALKNQYGSSALSHAIQESVQYFREGGGEARGNILVLTDGEETAEGLDLKLPKEIHVALVGIGTSQGGRIPLDDGRGFRFGYKKERGRDVITKLNESFFKRVTSELHSAKYWIANSYSLPSEEILEFFQREKIKSKDQQDMIIKPVLMEWVVVPSVLLLILSYVFKTIRVFSLSVFLLIAPIKAQAKEPEITPEIAEKLERLQNGDLTRLERIKLADDLQKAGAKEEAIELYRENLPSQIEPGIPPEAYLNHGTALLEKGEVQRGLDLYQNLGGHLNQYPNGGQLKELMDKNVVSYFQQQEQKKQQQKEKKQNQKNQQDQSKNSEEDQGGQGQQKDQSNSQGQQQQKKPDQGGDQNKEEDKNKEKSDQAKKDEKNPEEEKDDKKDQQPQEEEKKRTPPKKVSAKLKQLMSDDRQLQMKMIENGTRDLNRRRSRTSKDW